MCLTTFFTSLTQRFPQLQLARPFEDLERRGKGLHSVGIKELLVTWPT
ncbi:putative thiosulfate sulfurtransferase domain protein [Mycobacterium tuberculosis variant bovis BCG]|nr:putative thiosulfate sulfurtransferase domain protein [Mycobacterium tuberculosis variant bovis BCG]